MSEDERMAKVADYAADAITFTGGKATQAITILADAMAVLIVSHFEPDIAARAIPDFAGYVADQARSCLAAQGPGSTVQ